MARIVQIPLSFEFRRVRAKWSERESRVVGLSWDPRGNDWDLKASAIGRGRKVEAELSRHDVPPRLWKQCCDAVGSFKNEDDWDNADSTIEKICADFHPRLLVASPDLDEDMYDAEKHSLPADAWQLRDDFLHVASDVSSVLAFLNRWGRWDLRRYTQIHRVVGFQNLIRRALLSSPDEWLSDDAEFFELDEDAFERDLDLERKSAYPYFSVDTLECKSAISRTVTIDLLRRVKFGTCARKDCGQPFPIESRHKRKFCCWYCGHLESVRKGRAKQHIVRSLPAAVDRHRIQR